jgi:hypothetical protein
MRPLLCVLFVAWLAAPAAGQAAPLSPAERERASTPIAAKPPSPPSAAPATRSGSTS